MKLLICVKTECNFVPSEKNKMDIHTRVRKTQLEVLENSERSITAVFGGVLS